MDENSSYRHLLDIELEIKRCRGRLADLSPIIREAEGERVQVGGTSSLILHQGQNLTHLSVIL